MGRPWWYEIRLARDPKNVYGETFTTRADASKEARALATMLEEAFVVVRCPADSSLPQIEVERHKPRVKMAGGVAKAGGDQGVGGVRKAGGVRARPRCETCGRLPKNCYCSCGHMRSSHTRTLCLTESHTDSCGRGPHAFVHAEYDKTPVAARKGRRRGTATPSSI